MFLVLIVKDHDVTKHQGCLGNDGWWKKELLCVPRILDLKCTWGCKPHPSNSHADVATGSFVSLPIPECTTQSKRGKIKPQERPLPLSEYDQQPRLFVCGCVVFLEGILFAVLVLEKAKTEHSTFA